MAKTKQDAAPEATAIPDPQAEIDRQAEHIIKQIVAGCSTDLNQYDMQGRCIGRLEAWFEEQGRDPSEAGRFTKRISDASKAQYDKNEKARQQRQLLRSMRTGTDLEQALERLGR